MQMPVNGGESRGIENVVQCSLMPMRLVQYVRMQSMPPCYPFRHGRCSGNFRTMFCFDIGTGSWSFSSWTSFNRLIFAFVFVFESYSWGQSKSRYDRCCPNLRLDPTERKSSLHISITTSYSKRLTPSFSQLPIFSLV
jgi:hypothetical protein